MALGGDSGPWKAFVWEASSSSQVVLEERSHLEKAGGSGPPHLGPPCALGRGQELSADLQEQSLEHPRSAWCYRYGPVFPTGATASWTGFLPAEGPLGRGWTALMSGGQSSTATPCAREKGPQN